MTAFVSPARRIAVLYRAQPVAEGAGGKPEGMAMKRTRWIAGAAVLLLCSGLTQAQGQSGSFPDMGAIYFHRANCHEAYDLVVEEVTNGGGNSADVAWATSYEDAANAGEACPEPGAELAARATDRAVKRFYTTVDQYRERATEGWLRSTLTTKETR